MPVVVGQVLSDELQAVVAAQGRSAVWRIGVKSFISRFVNMLTGSHVDEYEFWFTKKGKHPAEQYPTERGDATLMSGAANYKRLAKELEQSWRANLHTNSTKVVVKI